MASSSSLFGLIESGLVGMTFVVSQEQKFVALNIIFEIFVFIEQKRIRFSPLIQIVTKSVPRFISIDLSVITSLISLSSLAPIGLTLSSMGYAVLSLFLSVHISCWIRDNAYQCKIILRFN